jgi:molybdate transport system ATP-binding protein
MTLRAHLGLTLGAFDLDVDLETSPGEVVALLGPNGAGKTTVLRALAGLTPIHRGRIEITSADTSAVQVLDDAATSTFVPPELRPIGVVFQEYRLFPHLSVLDNVAFGLRARGMNRRAAAEHAHRWLERVGLDGFADRRPASLSGGQAQRVALARALATEPAVLLLDEPLAALDAGTRGEIRRELRRHLDGFAGTRLLVTHDPVDAQVLADRVIVLEHGRIVQSGTLADVTAHPRSRYVADLVGTNLVRGEFRNGELVTPTGATLVGDAHQSAAGPSLALIPPGAIALHRSRPEGSPRNVVAGIVSSIDEHLDRVRISLDGTVPLVAEITPGALAELSLHPGDEVWAAFKATEVVIYAA